MYELIGIINSIVFFFLHVHTRGEMRIRNSDLCFLKRGPQPTELPFGDHQLHSWNTLICQRLMRI
jgi:hypothetical protein